jgi:hypothetical protein
MTSFSPVSDFVQNNSSITILYGSETGTAEDVAFQLCALIESRFEISASVKSCDEYNISELQLQQLIIFIISTTGDGEIPSNMKNFWRFLLQSDQLRSSAQHPLAHFTCLFGLPIGAGLDVHGRQPAPAIGPSIEARDRSIAPGYTTFLGRVPTNDVLAREMRRRPEVHPIPIKKSVSLLLHGHRRIDRSVDEDVGFRLPPRQTPFQEFPMLIGDPIRSRPRPPVGVKSLHPTDLEPTAESKAVDQGV